MTYRVGLSRPARRALDRLPRSIGDRVLEHISALASNPRPPGCRKLAGRSETWRIRIGDYRVIYEIDDGSRNVTVQRVAQRGAAYRW